MKLDAKVTILLTEFFISRTNIIESEGLKKLRGAIKIEKTPSFC